MKIAFVLDDTLDKPDGVQQYVKTLGKYFSSHGHTVHFICGRTEDKRLRAHSMSKNVNVRFNGNALSIPLPSSAKKIRSLLNTEQYDVLHIQMPYSPFMAHVVIREAPASTAIVGTFHILPYGHMSELGSRVLRLAIASSLRRMQAICAVSSPAAIFAKKAFGIDAQIIPNAVDSTLYRPGPQKQQTKVVFLGRLVKRKGCMEFLKAIRLVSPELRRQYEIVVAGKGPESVRLKRYAEKNALDVKFLGFIPEKDKPKLLNEAKLAVFPSIAGESFGIVLIEAMASGSGVVIAGNNPGYSAVLKKTPDSLIDPMDHSFFAAEMQRHLTDAAHFKAIHTLQQKLVKDYDISRVGPDIVEMYKSAIAKLT